MQNEAIDNQAEKQVLVFSLANEELGLDIHYAREVLRLEVVHPLVQGPGFIEGVINLRNHIIAVMDLRKRFDLKPREDNSGARIIICKVDKFIVGLIVDGVSEVLSLSKADIQATPGVVSMQMKDNYLSGIAKAGERIIYLIDLARILTSEEIINLSTIKK